MSARYISENLIYTIDNQGVTLTVPFLTINALLTTWTGTFNLNGAPITTGTVTGSTSINVGVAPGRILTSYYPRHVTWTKQFNLLAGVPQALDWVGSIMSAENFSEVPSPGTAGTHVGIKPLSTTDFQFLRDGVWLVTANAQLTVTLTDTARITMQLRRSFNSGGAYAIHQSNFEAKDVGSPFIDFIGGNSSFLENVGIATGVETVQVMMTCTENKTVNVGINFTFLSPTI